VALYQKSKTRLENKTIKTTPISKKYNMPSVAAESFGMSPPKGLDACHTHRAKSQNNETQETLRNY
jgi:hypothetical protein